MTEKLWVLVTLLLVGLAAFASARVQQVGSVAPPSQPSAWRIAHTETTDIGTITIIRHVRTGACFLSVTTTTSNTISSAPYVMCEETR